jgi:hypothetical protein
LFLNINNEQFEKEIKKTIPFTIASKRITCLGIILTKALKDLHAKTENQGMLLLGFQVVFQLKSQWSCA